MDLQTIPPSALRGVEGGDGNKELHDACMDICTTALGGDKGNPQIQQTCHEICDTISGYHDETRS
jgi:hypothetical protein